MNTNFKIGVVIDVQDVNKRFEFLARLEDGREITVLYTSPFFFVGGGGQLTPPNTGSLVIIMEHSSANSLNYYYISTIVGGTPPDWIYDPSIKILPLTEDPTIYTEKNIPQKIHYTNEVGSGLRISRKKLLPYIDSKVELKSEFNKKISLIDSPMHSHILMRNEHGDGIRIVSHDWLAMSPTLAPHPIYPSRSIIVFSKGPQFYTTTRGLMDMKVVDGTEFNIQNYSTGAFGPSGHIAPPPSAPASEAIPSRNKNYSSARVGNINIRSINSDVNIAVNGTESEIYITTPKARVEIREDGTVLIHSAATINLRADGDITMKSNNGNINMEAGGGAINLKSSSNCNIQAGSDVNIKSSDNLKVQSGKIMNLKAQENCNVDGLQIHLNSGFSTVAAEASSPRQINIQKNAYGE